MIGTLDVIDRLPFELQARLEADAFFNDITVVVAEEGNVALMLAVKQAVVSEKSGKTGLAVIILQVIADDDLPEVAFGSMTLKPGFQVIENLELNRGVNGTGKSARRVARYIRDLVKPLALVGLTTEFIPDNPCIRPVALGKELGDLVKSYAVNFKTFEADDEGTTLVSTPQFSATADVPPMLQVTCGTDGADVWYTLDDSFPAPGVGTSVLYAGPLAVPDAGFTMRAAGYKTGCIASQVNRGLITKDFS